MAKEREVHEVREWLASTLRRLEDTSDTSLVVLLSTAAQLKRRKGMLEFGLQLDARVRDEQDRRRRLIEYADLLESYRQPPILQQAYRALADWASWCRERVRGSGLTESSAAHVAAGIETGLKEAQKEYARRVVQKKAPPK